MRFVLRLRVKDGKLIWNQSYQKGVFPNNEDLNGKKVKIDDLLEEINRYKSSLIVFSIQELKEGETTPRGKYPKLRNNEKCAYPKRQDCNYGDGYERCRYMEFDSPGRWDCKYK